jgi:hypothetical protein
MANMTVAVKAEMQNVEPVSTLIELLGKYQDQLPEELLQSLLELAECGATEFTVKDWDQLGYRDCKVETDFHTDRIVSANRILKRVRWHDDDGYELEAYPEKFKLGAKGHVILEWGY